MMKSKLTILALTMGLAFGANAANETMNKDQYKAEKDRIEAQYKQAKQSCDGMKGNQKDVCEKEAKGQEKVAKAELEAKQKNTDKARRDAAMAKIDAEYDVAKEKCDDLKGNEKDACLKDAKSAHQTAKAGVEQQHAASAASGATGSRGDAREAREDAREAKQEAAEARREAAQERAKQ